MRISDWSSDVCSSDLHAQAARMRAQWEAPRPLFKQLWQKIIVAKISMQASLLAAQGRDEANALTLLARRVRSGDPDNLEAQAARKYWPALLGSDFRRDQNADGPNALLNYGYTVVRSCEIGRASCRERVGQFV